MDSKISYAYVLSRSLFLREGLARPEGVSAIWGQMTQGQRAAYVLVTPLKIVAALAMELIVRVVSTALAPLLWINSWCNPLDGYGRPLDDDLTIIAWGDAFATLARQMWEMTFGGKPTPLNRFIKEPTSLEGLASHWDIPAVEILRRAPRP
jgi:hypothetical protein